MVRKIVQGTIFPREDGKIIDQHFGVLNMQHDAFSLAHMYAPVRMARTCPDRRIRRDYHRR